MKEPDKIAALIQEYKHRKETHQKQVSFTHEIKFSGNITPFRSEEQVRVEMILKSKPVQIKDILTKEITKFDTFEECVKYMGVNWVTFERMLKGQTQFFHQWQLIK